MLVGAQVFSGTGLAAGIAVGALLAQDMIGGTTWSGLPAALFTLGSAIAAFVVGAVSQRAGRRPGLSLGFGVGALGGAGTVAAATIDSVPLLVVSLVLYGWGTATNLQARYAGADLAPPQRRGRAISIVLVATTLGAVVGPNLVDEMGRIAEAFGIPHLAGPFMLSSVAYLVGAAVVFALLRPDPLLVARGRAVAVDGLAPATRTTTDTHSVRLATAVMVVAQMVMIAVMTMTPVHMKAHGQSLRAADSSSHSTSPRCSSPRRSPDRWLTAWAVAR